MIDNSNTNTPLIDGDLAGRVLTVNNTLKVTDLAGTGNRPVVVDATGQLKTGNGLRITGVVEYADNATAVQAGLQIGDVYRTGDNLKIVH